MPLKKVLPEGKHLNHVILSWMRLYIVLVVKNVLYFK